MTNPVVISTLVHGLTIEVRALGLATMVVSVITYSMYIKAMIDGRHKPPRSSWCLWTVLDAVAFASNLAAGTFDSMLFIYTAGTFVVSLFTLRYGKKGWTNFETLCSAIVFGVIVIWVAKGPEVAMICAMGGITVAFLPLLWGVLCGAYEDLWSWSLVIVGGLLNLADGQILTSVWFMTLQIIIVVVVSYHHLYLPQQAIND